MKKTKVFLAGVIVAGAVLFSTVAYPSIADSTIRIIMNGSVIPSDVSPLLTQGRTLVPIRVISEGLGAKVQWDQKNNAVVVTGEGKGSQGDGGSSYLKGENFAQGDKGISNNMISARDLKNLLDDDADNDIADYRSGHNGGDSVKNDPLVVDVRGEAEYLATHIPSATWIAAAPEMGDQENINQLKKLLKEHVALGGKNEIVLYCYTGNQSGLLAGVLGVQGLPVKNMMYGFDIAWQGTKTADRAIKAPMENSGGEKVECKT
ncbi:stalk domain-containing protein [Dehalobacterium formicoaceticum]|uniref:stalk domain-containing protein n=1 Tax=Dehalobacterium formicoaceticum TaxID=51515 RepID=UPI000B7D7D07|nr:stalk domain-containing protein [Dehalobacterium formicoaceticum]